MGSLYNNDFLHTYISKLQVDLSSSSYTEVGNKWKGYDVNYPHNKLYFIKKGTCFINIDGTDFFPSENQFILLPCGSTSTFYTVNNSKLKKHQCIFDANIHDVPFFSILKTPLCIDASQPEVVEELFNKLHTVNRNSDITSVILAKAYLTELLAIFISDCDKCSEITIGKYDAFITRMMTYINEHLIEDISVEDMAEHMSFHPKYFSKLFKQKFGITPAKYLKRLRIEKAKSLLANGNDSIQSIVYKCGFNNTSLFIKNFKEQLGCTPSGYRAKLKAGT